MQREAGGLTNLAEDSRKGRIFTYFLGTVMVLGGVDLVYNLYISLTLQDFNREEYFGYLIGDMILLTCFGLIWWGHHWYPHLARHVFLILIAVGVIFSFPVDELELIFVGMSLPILMAAFLIRPVYSYAYWSVITAAYTLRLYWAEVLTPEGFFFSGLAALLVLAVVSWLIAGSLDRALAEAQALNRELDQRVQDRTQELAAALARETTTAVRNETILRSIADGVLVFDANDQVMISNPAANLFARRELQNLVLDDFLAPIETNDGKAASLINTWVREGQKPADQNNVRFEWHGRTLSANVAPVILPTTEKQVDAGHVMVLRDFTKEAELERVKNLFLGMVSHELRTPMSAIKGYVEILLQTEKENVSASGYEYLQTIGVSIKQLLTLANELIDLSRMETGEIELYRDWTDLSPIIKQAAKIVQQEYTARDLTLAVKIEPDLPELYLDRNRILQVLLNLLSNAYKYTRQGGTTVTTRLTDEWVYVTVSDTGVGIKAEDQANLFNRFFRASDQFVQQAGGTGLGLSISKGLIELHGGRLTFESKYGQGASFTVALPKNGVEGALTP